ncbi:MAG: putative bifunctional diguanylate cyclase/phosphodiesterase [Nitrospirota bacterium]
MGTPLRVLIVEDSEDDATLLVHELRNQYDVAYELVQTAQAMADALERHTWDIVISDYDLPNFSAPKALELLRNSGIDLPFIILSGCIGEDTAVAAMKAGAHDSLLKGNLKRLIPSIQRELREADVRRERKRLDSTFRAIMESAPDAIVLVNREGRIVLHNPQTERLFGYSPDELRSQPIEILIPERLRGTHVAHRTSYSSHPNLRPMGAGRELYGRRKDGSEFPAEISLSPVHTDDGALVMSIIRDITARKQAEDLIQHIAFHDPLTDLPNRNLLNDRLLDAIRRDEGTGQPMALLLLDLDRFKEVNNTLGHDHGDRLLQEVGRRLKGALYEQDMVARLGGDEFAVWLPKIADGKHVTLVIQKIQEALRSPFILENIPIIVEASIGVAIYPDHGGGAETLFRRADVAMYQAKKSGSGYAVYNRDQDRYNPIRLALMGELRHAIDHNELLLHYQPKIGLKTRTVAGAEALVRWKHPNRRMIPPDQFIGPAEQTGLIYPLTHWVLQAAMRQCGEWWRAGVKMPVSVNLSARNLSDPKLPGQVADLLRMTGVSPDWMTFEITESAIMADPAHAERILNTLQQMGIRISIDDFGTGYSSLSYLRKLPVDRLKVDKSFVLHMTENEGDAKIVRSTIDLAHNLGLKVVAEGVETQEVLDRLTHMGCDLAQGYYMSKPLPAHELTRWLKHSPWGLKPPAAA